MRKIEKLDIKKGISNDLPTYKDNVLRNKINQIIDRLEEIAPSSDVALNLSREEANELKAALCKVYNIPNKEPEHKIIGKFISLL